MEVTNEDLLKRLDRIEAMLKTLTSEEERELKELDETINLEFNNPEDWRRYIWENCPFKAEKSEGSEVDFYCKKKGGVCRFEGCPINVKVGK